jgi:hypothetical protein
VAIPQDGFKDFIDCVQVYREAIDAHLNLVEAELADESSAALERRRQISLAFGLLTWTSLIPRIGGSALRAGWPYASQCGLPTPHARLASGRSSGATGRAFHP